MRSIFSPFLFLFNFTAGVEKDRFKQTLLLSEGDLLFLKQQTRRKTLQICSSTHTHKKKPNGFAHLEPEGRRVREAGRGGAAALRAPGGVEPRCRPLPVSAARLGAAGDPRQ